MTQSTIARVAHYYRELPTLTEEGAEHWITRAANFVVVATRACSGVELSRDADVQTDEYMVLLPAAVSAEIRCGQETLASRGDSLTIIPPGSSSVRITANGWIYRIFSKRAVDLAGAAQNSDDYREGASGVKDLELWPAPDGPDRLRHYELENYVRQDSTMRLFRSRNLMVNIFLPNKAPRDVRKMSPHSHSDFEQGSLCINGAYVHHVRYPWGPDMTQWRADCQLIASTPSLLIVPPNVIHTSQALGNSGMRLIDIFSPPRADFSLKPGLVNNADEYPLPEELRGATATGSIG